MKLRVFQFDRALSFSLPKLYAHFLSLRLAPEVLVSQWMITLFSYTVPLQLTVDLWDYLLVGGWTAVFRIALALLKASAELVHWTTLLTPYYPLLPSNTPYYPLIPPTTSTTP